jgi:hypothetical protein
MILNSITFLLDLCNVCMQNRVFYVSKTVLFLLEKKKCILTHIGAWSNILGIKSAVCCLQDWLRLHELYKSINGITIVCNTLEFTPQQCSHGINLSCQTSIRVYMCSRSCCLVWSSSETTLSLQEFKFSISFVSFGYKKNQQT